MAMVPSRPPMSRTSSPSRGSCTRARQTGALRLISGTGPHALEPGRMVPRGRAPATHRGFDRPSGPDADGVRIYLLLGPSPDDDPIGYYAGRSALRMLPATSRGSTRPAPSTPSTPMSRCPVCHTYSLADVSRRGGRRGHGQRGVPDVGPRAGRRAHHHVPPAGRGGVCEATGRAASLWSPTSTGTADGSSRVPTSRSGTAPYGASPATPMVGRRSQTWTGTATARS